jgi:hypothetical protein
VNISFSGTMPELVNSNDASPLDGTSEALGCTW